jgi:hypothetical protein
MRGPDFVARYGDDEFVVVMPSTTLAGANVFGDRLRKRVMEDLDTSVCCGITQAHSADDSRSLFARADSALYSAKAAGANRLFVHTGTHIREHGTPSGASSLAVKSTPASCSSGSSPVEASGCRPEAPSADACDADKQLSASATA